MLVIPGVTARGPKAGVTCRRVREALAGRSQAKAIAAHHGVFVRGVGSCVRGPSRPVPVVIVPDFHRPFWDM
jgi:hypothetical protein